MSERATTGVRPSRWLDLERDVSGSIYGTIITATALVGVAEGVDRLGQIVLTVAVTLLLYAVAHAYSRVLGAPRGRTGFWTPLARELAGETPMLTACVLPLLVVIGAGLVGASLDLALEVGLAVAVVMLFAWGLVAAGRAHRRALPRLLSAAVFGLLGLGIVALRATTGH